MGWYQRHATIVWAEQWKQGVNDDLIDRVGGMVSDGRALIPTPEGDLPASPFDWIVTGVAGEHHLCKPNDFVSLYVPLQES
jgi:hypothetical protein